MLNGSLYTVISLKNSQLQAMYFHTYLFKWMFPNPKSAFGFLIVFQL